MPDRISAKSQEAIDAVMAMTLERLKADAAAGAGEGATARRHNQTREGRTA